MKLVIACALRALLVTVLVVGIMIAAMLLVQVDG